MYLRVQRLERTDDSVGHVSKERSEKLSRALMHLGRMLAWGPGYGQGADLGRITILEPRGDSSGCRISGHQS